MDYPTLLLQLENQLQSLHKKGFHYMNIEAMPKVGLRRLLDGLGEILDSPTEDVDKLSKYNFPVCLLYTSPSPRDGLLSRMPSSA